KSGPGYTLTAASAGLTGATSSAFNITAGAAAQLAFSAPLSNATAGAGLPAMQVIVQDALGNLVTSSTATVTAAIGTNPGGGTLSGTVSRAAVAGVATFNDLSINRTGAGYTLTAASAGLTGATSSAFNISAGAASRLAFATVNDNMVPSVRVMVQDALGNTVTASSASVTVAIGTNPGGGT